MCVSVRVCVRACVRACVQTCAHARIRVDGFTLLLATDNVEFGEWIVGAQLLLLDWLRPIEMEMVLI